MNSYFNINDSSLRKDIKNALQVIEKMTNKEERKALLAKSINLNSDPFNKIDDIEIFYIACINAGNMTDDLDIHLEKIIEKDISQYFDNFFFPTNFQKSYFSILITNDTDILSKYKFAINYDEFIMLCGFDNYNKHNITINKEFIKPLNIDCFEYFIKVLVNQIVSATMNIVSIPPVVDWDGTEYYSEVDTSFEGWLENREFNFFKPPCRYKNLSDHKGVFELENIEKANLKTLQEIFNVNILEIGNHVNTEINWEIRNDHLRYYDRVSNKRLYIKPILLEYLKLDSTISLKINIKFTESHYIEYYITDFENKIFDKTIHEIKTLLNYEKIELYRANDADGNPTSSIRSWDNKRRICIIIEKDLAEEIKQYNNLALDFEKTIVSGKDGYFLSVNVTKNNNNDHNFNYSNESHESHKFYEQYNGTYAQDVEGLSDDFINDVLDGDPDNYWNID